MRGFPFRQQPGGLLPSPSRALGNKRILPVATGKAGRCPSTPSPFEKGERKLYVSGRETGCTPKKPSHDGTRHPGFPSRVISPNVKISPAFQKGRGFQRRRLWPPLARGGTLFFPITREGGRRPASGGRWRRGKPTYGVSPPSVCLFDFGSRFPAVLSKAQS